MALNKEGLIQELKHQIHSPLAAVRNALILQVFELIIRKRCATWRLLKLRSRGSPPS